MKLKRLLLFTLEFRINFQINERTDHTAQEFVSTTGVVTKYLELDISIILIFAERICVNLDVFVHKDFFLWGHALRLVNWQVSPFGDLFTNDYKHIALTLLKLEVHIKRRHLGAVIRFLLLAKDLQFGLLALFAIQSTF